MKNLLSNDLDFILEHTQTVWDELRNQKIFITGGTGFFGAWLLESFVWANKKLNLNASMTVLTRDANAFAKKCPHLFADSALKFHEGDVKSFAFPEGTFSHVIHAATDASAALNENNPVLMFDTILEGTKRTLEFAHACQAKRYLFTSSGAVYGRQPPELTHVTEEYVGYPRVDDARSAYAIGKYAAEHLCTLYAKQYGLDIKIARCFAFVGPYLPLDIHFAIGNFIRDGLRCETIQVGGDGSPYRSYLYAADLAIWLWTILISGQTLRPYNVGSDEAFNIAEIAQLVASAFEPVKQVKIAKPANAQILPDRYVPGIKRAREELGLKPRVGLLEAIQATKSWYEMCKV